MKGEQHTVVVESLANSGDGVGRINEKVVFIPYACPGDTLEVKITLSKKSFLKASIVNIIEHSPHRVEPSCPVFGQCGGCDWQHVNYETQLDWKKQNLIDVIKRIGGLDIEKTISAVKESTEQYHYRNRIQLHQDKKGFFYYAKGSKTPIHIKQCPIASKVINTHIAKTPTSFKGSVKKVEFAENDENSVDCYFVDEKGQSDLGFRQVNTKQNYFLISRLMDVLTKYKIKSVFDLYCGQGNWSLAIANQHPEITCVGIDSNPINIKKAKELAGPNLNFLLGDVMEIYKSDLECPDLVIIDPPRAGCDPALLQTLSENAPEWLIYISCHPASMARDLKILSASQWSIEEIIPVDMFPQTAHLETFCLLRSATGAKTAK